MVTPGARLNIATNNPEILAGRDAAGHYYLTVTDEQGNRITVSSERRELLQRLTHAVSEALRESKGG